MTKLPYLYIYLIIALKRWYISAIQDFFYISDIIMTINITNTFYIYIYIYIHIYIYKIITMWLKITHK